jgi:hypothetical protein
MIRLPQKEHKSGNLSPRKLAQWEQEDERLMFVAKTALLATCIHDRGIKYTCGLKNPAANEVSYSL